VTVFFRTVPPPAAAFCEESLPAAALSPPAPDP